MIINSLIDKLKIKVKRQRFKNLCQVGDNLNVGSIANVFKEEGGRIEIGNNCDIHATLSVKSGAIIKIGNNTTIRGFSVVGAVENITIGNCCIISNNVHIYDNNNHPTDVDIRHKMCLNGFYGDAWNWKYSSHSPIIIEDDVWIGERSTILKGVRIGRGCIVASNAVVTKDTPPLSIVAGNPAVVVKRLKNEATQKT